MAGTAQCAASTPADLIKIRQQVQQEKAKRTYGTVRPVAPSALCVPGAVAGMVQCAVSTPVDLLKIRQQLQRVAAGAPGYVGPLHLLREVWRSEGLAGAPSGDTPHQCNNNVNAEPDARDGPSGAYV